MRLPSSSFILFYFILQVQTIVSPVSINISLNTLEIDYNDIDNYVG